MLARTQNAVVAIPMRQGKRRIALSYAMIIAPHEPIFPRYYLLLAETDSTFGYRRQPSLQPEAIRAVMEVTKWLKPLDIHGQIRGLRLPGNRAGSKDTGRGAPNFSPTARGAGRLAPATCLIRSSKGQCQRTGVSYPVPELRQHCQTVDHETPASSGWNHGRLGVDSAAPTEDDRAAVFKSYWSREKYYAPWSIVACHCAGPVRG